MRRAVALLAVAACHDGGAPGTACGTSAPELASCAAGGLADIDLDGTWTFHGTTTTTAIDPPGAPMTVTASFTVTISLDGCGFGFDGDTSGTIDATNAVAPATEGEDEHGEGTVCAGADGTIYFDRELGWDRRARGGDNGESTDSGTLTR